MSTQVCSKTSLIKNSSKQWRKTRPTVQHKSNCIACFLCYRITCWRDDGSLSPNNAIRNLVPLTQIAGSVLQVNIVVILESLINYDKTIMFMTEALVD